MFNIGKNNCSVGQLQEHNDRYSGCGLLTLREMSSKGLSHLIGATTSFDSFIKLMDPFQE